MRSFVRFSSFFASAGGEPPGPPASMSRERALEEAGLVARTVLDTSPVRVEYALTDDGERLRPIVKVMMDFGQWLKKGRGMG